MNTKSTNKYCLAPSSLVFFRNSSKHAAFANGVRQSSAMFKQQTAAGCFACARNSGLSVIVLKIVKVKGPILIIFFILLIDMFFNNIANASSTPKPLHDTQLAYFIGYHSYNRNPVVIYPRPIYRARGAYWTPWIYKAYNCQHSCLIDKWTGLVIQCKQRC